MNRQFMSSQLYIHGIMLFVTFLSASSFPVSASITNTLDPTITTFLRFALATAFFFPYVIFKKSLKLPMLEQLVYYAILSIPLVFFFWTMFESLRYTSAINTSALFTLVPAITAMLAFFLNKEKTGQIRSIGLAVGIIGALWIVFRGDLGALLGLEFNKGDLIFLTGAISLALYGPLFKRFHNNQPIEVTTFWILFISSMLLFVIFGQRLWDVQWSELKFNSYIEITYLAMIYSIAFILRQHAIVRLGATKVSAYNFLNPIFVIIMTVMTGIGDFDVVLLPGIFLILSSIFLIQNKKNDVQP